MEPQPSNPCSLEDSQPQDKVCSEEDSVKPSLGLAHPHHRQQPKQHRQRLQVLEVLNSLDSYQVDFQVVGQYPWEPQGTTQEQRLGSPSLFQDLVEGAWLRLKVEHASLFLEEAVGDFPMPGRLVQQSLNKLPVDRPLLQVA